MIAKSSDSIGNWLRKSNNRKVNTTYHKARHYLDPLLKGMVLSPIFMSKPDDIVTIFCQENFSEYGDASSQLLDDAINSVLVSYLWLKPHDIKISALAKEEGWKRSDLVAYLQYMKSQLVDRASFLHFLAHCLDKDPFAAHNPAFALHIDKFEKSIPVLGTEGEHLEQVLGGVALFLQTPVDEITCIPKYAAILLKNAAPCWIFLSLNLARNQQPSYMVMYNLLNEKHQVSLLNKNPAMDKILRCISTAFFQCLSVCGGQKFADIVFERYGLADFKDQSLLADIRNDFLRYTLNCYCAQKGSAKFKRALSRRDPGHNKFDNDNYLANLDDMDEYTQRLMGVVYNHISALSGWHIKDRFIYLNLFQKILDLDFIGENPIIGTTPRYTVSKTFNFLLFEHITSLTTIAVHHLGVHGSLDPFFFLPETIPDKYWFPDEEIEILKPFYAPPQSGNPLYPPNKIELNLDECEFLHQVTLLLSSTLKPADAACFGEIDTMRDYLKNLFVARPLLSPYADKESYGVPSSIGQGE